MTENRKKILEMLSKNKISIDDAYRLLNVIDSGEGEPESTAKEEPVAKARPKYLRVTVVPNPEHKNADNVDRVNVRVPMSLIRAGIKLTSLIPSDAMDKVSDTLKDRGIDFDVRSVKSEDLEELIEALGDMEIDVESGKGERVKVFVE
jgi:hypothetical protein